MPSKCGHTYEGWLAGFTPVLCDLFEATAEHIIKLLSFMCAEKVMQRLTIHNCSVKRVYVFLLTDSSLSEGLGYSMLMKTFMPR